MPTVTPIVSTSEHPLPSSTGKLGTRPSSYPLSVWLRTAFFLTIAITGITSAIVGVCFISKGISDQAQEKAHLDLNSARLIYNDRIKLLRTTLRLASLQGSLIEAVTSGHIDAIRAQSSILKKDWNYDYFEILNPEGRLLARGDSGAMDLSIRSPMVSEVVAGKVDAVGTMVRDTAALELVSPEVAQRARLVLQTPDGPEQPQREVTAGLVLEGATAVRRGDGMLIAIVHGGVLLNHDESTVDEIKRTIYSKEPIDGHTTGGASLCLGDIRVATSILLKDGRRAIGTTVDPIVRKRVLDQDKPLVDRASVLGHSYFTAYEPIHDPSGRAIGILSIGVPERNFSLLRNEALLLFLGIVLCGAVAAFQLAEMLARRIVHPIQELTRAMRSYEHGNMELRLAPFTRSPAEFTELGNGLKAMAKALYQRQLQLKYRTEEQLGKAERLAMIGRLSAGVAHEINNPLGGILLFSSLLLKNTAPDNRDHSALERICNEAKRCQQIVQGLLDFARPREPKREQIVLDNVVDRTLQLVSGQSLFHNIRIAIDYEEPKPEVFVDPAQLQQVVLNLIVNAAEAMGGKGTLTLATRSVDDGTAAQIEVADSGCGIAPENLERLFEPFFTTKEAGKGTGLGLSISRSIVESHHGTIWAESEASGGTRFFIRLPTKGTDP